MWMPMSMYWMENLESRYEGVDLLLYVKKIQRTLLHRARARRHMAVFMAFHVRLGKDSPMACLPEDIPTLRSLTAEWAAWMLRGLASITARPFGIFR